MTMTTTKLIILRSYNLTFGRFDFGRKFLRKILEKMLIKKNYAGRYGACTKYFNQDSFKK